MPEPYAFYFDASSCTGCKACQMACKDRHGLRVGLLWRRVYEVVGGGWRRSGAAWVTDVHAYYLSLACNHCARPICVEVCPAGAIHRRDDGIVLLDPRQCIGCRYCEWACPYGAPQYDEEAGTMTKCTFCADLIDRGQPPACVAACPMRALDFGPRAELEARYGPLEAVDPLPADELTSPALVLTPPQRRPPLPLSLLSPGGEGPGEAGAVDIANREEVGRR